VSVTAMARVNNALHSIYTLPMAMGKHKRDRPPSIWAATTGFPTAASHPFYS